MKSNDSNLHEDRSHFPGYEHGDEPLCNFSENPTFSDIVDARFARRTFLAGSLSSAIASAFGIRNSRAAGPTSSQQSLLGFDPIPTHAGDRVTLPSGYRVQILAPLGTPITGDSPEAALADGGKQQAMQVGSHHDGMHFFPIDGSSHHGVLVINHEYVEPRYLHEAYQGQELDTEDVVVTEGHRDADEVLKEINAHGVSIFRIQRDAQGRWDIQSDPLNRRITGLHPMSISGPVRGSVHVRTKYSPEGTMARGTLNNCSHGVTPWNTYLAAEENWAGYFCNGDVEDQEPALPREHARYGVSTGESRYRWELAAGGADEFVRFDASSIGADASEDYRNEPNTFGWMVEIDPFDSNKLPVKRTQLGRFAHEGVIFAPAIAGRPIVCYSGDDARFEYIYKYVSAAPYEPATANGELLDEGALYVAKFNEDGSGQWLPLVHGHGGLTPENGFANQADILVNTRLAADHLGATKMDRPEWGAVDPRSGEVYFTLTNNTRRDQAQIDAVNPRPNNAFGQIVRWREANGDHASKRFTWDLFVLCGDRDDSRDPLGDPLGEHNVFACPDGLWFDADGRLWIQTDIGEAVINRGVMEIFGNNQMLAADPRTGEIRRFLTGPIGQEITGVVTTPDQRTMFVNVQHPGANTTPRDFAAGRYTSHWPDGGNAIPRSATLAISRKDGGVIGS